jgi:hypothetical protein
MPMPPPGGPKPAREMTPTEERCPKTPQKDAGTRMEPPASPPSSGGPCPPQARPRNRPRSPQPPGQVMGVVGRAVDEVVALVVREAHRTLVLPRMAAPASFRRRTASVVLGELEPERGRQSGHVEGPLHRHGDAGQRQVGALCHGQVDLPRLVARAVEIAHNDRIDRSVESFDSRDRGVGQFQSANGFRADSRRELFALALASDAFDCCGMF